MSKIYFAEIEGVAMVRARDILLGKIFHKNLINEQVDICVEHLDSLPDSVCHKRVECVFLYYQRLIAVKLSQRFKV